MVKLLGNFFLSRARLFRELASPTQGKTYQVGNNRGGRVVYPVSDGSLLHGYDSYTQLKFIKPNSVNLSRLSSLFIFNKKVFTL
jgi:hypothetical protein